MFVEAEMCGCSDPLFVFFWYFLWTPGDSVRLKPSPNEAVAPKKKAA